MDRSLSGREIDAHDFQRGSSLARNVQSFAIFGPRQGSLTRQTPWNGPRLRAIGSVDRHPMVGTCGHDVRPTL
jgi:hypothetical protein